MKALRLLILGILAMAFCSALADTDIKVEVEGKGDIIITLFTNDAPKTTAHILKLVKEGYYDGKRVSRVVKSPRPYLVQIGEANGDRIPYENSGHSHVEGAVGLAADPGDRDSGGKAFYMLLAPAKFLDGNYTVFGRVSKGMDVVRSLNQGDRVVSITVSK